MIDFILLGFLMAKGMSGYEMKQKMQVSTSFFYNTSFGSIYPSLKKMEQNGWIKSEEIIDSGKYKKIYVLLPKEGKYFLNGLTNHLNL